ncbi:MAG TPA: hypothetical protein VFK06_14855 [Candidatus Angelobacter sp.]|nr:hypothetical protein [Candidatus Angelobacter sp.]
MRRNIGRAYIQRHNLLCFQMDNSILILHKTLHANEAFAQNDQKIAAIHGPASR